MNKFGLRWMLGISLLLTPSSAFALTPVGELLTPSDAPTQAPSWQAHKIESGDLHWTYALNYATNHGIIGPNASVAEQVQAVKQVMRMILDSPLNVEAKWGRDVVDQNRDGVPEAVYPTFFAGDTYYLPVTNGAPQGAVAAIAFSEAEIRALQNALGLEDIVDTAVANALSAPDSPLALHLAAIDKKNEDQEAAITTNRDDIAALQAENDELRSLVDQNKGAIDAITAILHGERQEQVAAATN